jgi:hypothetical protein
MNEEMSILPSSSSTSVVSVSDTISTRPPSYTTTTSALPSTKPPTDDIEVAARPETDDIELAARPEHETSNEILSRWRTELATAKEELEELKNIQEHQKDQVESKQLRIRLLKEQYLEQERLTTSCFRHFFRQLWLFLSVFIPGMTVAAPLLGSLAFAMHVDTYHKRYCQTNPELVRAHVNWIAHFSASLITLFLSACFVVPQVHTGHGESKLVVAGFLIFMSGFCLLVTVGFATITGDAFDPC